VVLEGLGQTTKSIGHDSRSPDRDTNPHPSEHKAGVLTNRLGRQILKSYVCIDRLVASSHWASGLRRYVQEFGATVPIWVVTRKISIVLALLCA
jgi:hypothetical protein